MEQQYTTLTKDINNVDNKDAIVYAYIKSLNKRDPNEVWMAIKPLLGNMIMIKKVVSQF